MNKILYAVLGLSILTIGGSLGLVWWFQRPTLESYYQWSFDSREPIFQEFEWQCAYWTFIGDDFTVEVTESENCGSSPPDWTEVYKVTSGTAQSCEQEGYRVSCSEPIGISMQRGYLTPMIPADQQ